MNTRERFLSIMSFQEDHRTLRWEFGYWRKTIFRWYEEGLPKIFGYPEQAYAFIKGEALAAIEDKDFQGKDVHEYFNLDEFCIQLPVNIHVPYEEKILEENDTFRIITDEFGAKKKDPKDGGMPQFLDYPIATREDFELMKERWQGISLEKRVPKDWNILKKQYLARTFPLALGGYPIGFFATLRLLMGPERLFYTFYDDPDLIKNMIDFLTDLLISVWGDAIEQIKPDYVQIWEDMCYKSGSLISPRMFRHFLSPAYKKLTDFLKSMGINIILVDSDGNITELIPLWVEEGITGFYPFEIQSGIDIVDIRKNFPKIQILGGIDKKSVAMGKKQIDNELEKVPFMLKQGGYIPFLDHSIPPDISWENFKYYRNQLDGMIKE